MLSDEWLPRYRLLENFNMKWNGNGNGNAYGNGNGNAYDRGDYNSSFALRAVELKNGNESGARVLAFNLLLFYHKLKNLCLKHIFYKTKIRSGYLQPTVTGQKTLKWLFTVNCHCPFQRFGLFTVQIIMICHT